MSIISTLGLSCGRKPERSAGCRPSAPGPCWAGPGTDLGFGTPSSPLPPKTIYQTTSLKHGTPLPATVFGVQHERPPVQLYAATVRRAGARTPRHPPAVRDDTNRRVRAVQWGDGRTSRRGSYWCALMKYHLPPLRGAPPDGTAPRMSCTAIAVVPCAPIRDECDGRGQGLRSKLPQRQPPLIMLCDGCKQVCLPIPAARAAEFNKVIGEQRRHFRWRTAHIGPQKRFLQSLQFLRISRTEGTLSRGLR
jgi:hypothetical protein